MRALTDVKTPPCKKVKQYHVVQQFNLILCCFKISFLKKVLASEKYSEKLRGLEVNWVKPQKLYMLLLPFEQNEIKILPRGFWTREDHSEKSKLFPVV